MKRAMGAGVMLAAALVFAFAGCGGDGGHGGSGGPVEGPPPQDGGQDGGVDDRDGGRDGGGDHPDGGSDWDGGTPIVIPQADGWQFYGRDQGGPQTVLGVSSDQAGNIWVAGGPEGLFLLEPGASTFRQFTVADGLASYTDETGVHGFDVLSVAGGPAGTAFVGYRGLFGGHEDNDPEYMVKSGDADKVVLSDSGIAVTHIDISTPPGEDPHYPNGRDKIRSVYRVVYDRSTGDVWFGGNHGIGVWSARAHRVFEHQHVAINGYNAQGVYTLLSGDWYGVAKDGAGDLWMGGGHRLGKIHYATEPGGFWANVGPIVDVWPDPVPADAHPSQRVDDYIQAVTVSGGNVWVGSIPNGLAVIHSGTTRYVRSGLVDPKVTALATDPADGSVWVGHLYGGITRLKNGQMLQYNYRVFGSDLINMRVPDIQSDTFGGQRRILVAFERGAIGVYTGN